MHRQQLRFGDLGDHPGQFFLHELMRRDGPSVELFPFERIGARRFVAVHGRARRAPTDAVAGL